MHNKVCMLRILYVIKFIYRYCSYLKKFINILTSKHGISVLDPHSFYENPDPDPESGSWILDPDLVKVDFNL
jgi:hypothetical protein